MRYAEAGFELNGAPSVAVHLYYRRRAEALREQFQRGCERCLRTAAELEVVEVNDAILSEGDEGDCLYDSGGRRIDASCVDQYDQDLTLSRRRAAPALSDLGVNFTIREPVVFQSVFFGHWGHFLLESISRAWATYLRPDLAELRSVFACGLRPDSSRRMRA